MMSDVNPYAAPAEWDPREADGSVPFAEMVDEAGQAIGIWRRGRILVMHKHARLPNRCVKSNQPTTPAERWSHKFVWCSWVVYLGLLINLLVLLILYLVLRKTATIEMGVSQRYLNRRLWALVGGWLVIIAGVVGFIMFLVAAFDGGQEPNPVFVVLSIGSIVAAIGGIVWAAWGSNIVSAKYIDKQYVWLRGVHRDYLAMLPEWPGK